MRYLLILLALAGCEQRYRYVCQNPDNWTSAQCQKPICEVNQECPDQIFSDQKRMDPWVNRDITPSTDGKDIDKGGKNDCAK